MSPAIRCCELTHLSRQAIDVERARAQHREYERLLARLGCTVQRISGGAEHPDAVFVEDTAVVLPELAVVARPGAQSRRAEVPAVAAALAHLRHVVYIEEPGTLDGGDVLAIGRAIFVGLSTRTNADAVAQLRTHVAPFGYTVGSVRTSGCLHLKSAVTSLGQGRVLINPLWVPRQPFAHYAQVQTDVAEPAAANVLTCRDGLIAAAAYPRTCDRLERAGLEVHRVDVSELAKAEGAVTCCSILVD